MQVGGKVYQPTSLRGHFGATDGDGFTNKPSFQRNCCNCCASVTAGGLVSAGGILVPMDTNGFQDIRDGTSNTLLVGECSDYIYDANGIDKNTQVNSNHGWLMGTDARGENPEPERERTGVPLTSPTSAIRPTVSSSDCPAWVTTTVRTMESILRTLGECNSCSPMGPSNSSARPSICSRFGFSRPRTTTNPSATTSVPSRRSRGSRPCSSVEISWLARGTPTLRSDKAERVFAAGPSRAFWLSGVGRGRLRSRRVVCSTDWAGKGDISCVVWRIAPLA